MDERPQRDPALQPYRLAVYISFFVGLAWFTVPMLIGVIKTLF
ncbi:MAG: hypothetical protein ACI9WU_001499 [Myxococcota bacterium]